MTRSLYLHLASAQECATATAALNRLSDLLKMVAALPVGGGVVLVSNAREKAEISDLILQYRGTATLGATRVVVGSGPATERGATYELVASQLFAAPGYKPCSRVVETMLQHGMGQRDEADVAPPSNAKAKPDPVYASVKVSPWPAGWEEQVEVPAKAPTPGPWHRVDDVPTTGLAIQIISETYERGPMPFRLRGELPKGCGGALNCAYPTQEASDAALPGFARRVREIWNNHTPRAAVKRAA